MQEKENYGSKLASMETQIQQYQTSIEHMRQEFNNNIINQKIEKSKNEKQDIDSKIVQMTNLMKSLNTQASARAKLNLKREEKLKREQVLKEICSSCLTECSQLNIDINVDLNTALRNTQQFSQLVEDKVT